MSEISKSQLKADNATSFPDNNSGYITPLALRNFNINIIDSTVSQAGYTTDSGSWNVSISKLNAYTASFQPSLTQLNAFTASQLTINTGVNGFTQSANASITNLNTFSSSFNTYTASINQIRSNGTVLGTSTIFNLVGPGTFFSASLVQNVQGNIATLTFTSDDAKVNTSSFNPFTSSINQFTASTNLSITNLNTYTSSQNSFNASATASISELLSFSASLDATYATDAQLNASASTLQANIDTKLNTSSFNDYTASQAGLNIFTSSINVYTASNNTKWTTIGLLTGSYATTGSNTFTGSQTITGSVYGNVVSMSIVSQTASMDLSRGNFFTLTLASGSTTQLAASNIKEGQTINLLVTQAAIGSGSLSYNSTFKFAIGNQYTASTTAGAKDILTFITFDSSSVYTSAIKSLQ